MDNPADVDARSTAERRFASPIPFTSASGISSAEPGCTPSNSPRIPATMSWCLPRRPFLRLESSTRRYFRIGRLAAAFCPLGMGSSSDAAYPTRATILRQLYFCPPLLILLHMQLSIWHTLAL